ncbi:MAG: SpoIID/LytB domain-containing protein [Prochlorococcus sp.]|mgnify:FL=1
MRALISIISRNTLAILTTGVISIVVVLVYIKLKGSEQLSPKDSLIQSLIDDSNVLQDSEVSYEKTTGSLDEKSFQEQVLFQRNAKLMIKVGLIAKGPPKHVMVEGSGYCKSISGDNVDEQFINHVLLSKQTGQIICRASNGKIVVNSSSYTGDVYLLNRGKGWLAVNRLNIEEYVASVVGAEMPNSWNIEALKAQAVAARSYAVAHIARPANMDFHLGDTPRWQAYGGLSSRTSRTTKATHETTGIILSYKGNIVESLYASTTDISNRAHGHLGASMSQHGAQILAQQGLKFNQILSRYYKGSSLARLRNRGN